MKTSECKEICLIGLDISISSFFYCLVTEIPTYSVQPIGQLIISIQKTTYLYDQSHHDGRNSGVVRD